MVKIYTLVLCILVGIGMGVLVDRFIVDRFIYQQQSKREAKELLFKVYGSDKEAMNIETNFYISIPKSLPMIEKLRIVADKLSRFKFNYLPIEVLRIEDKNGKKIAIINLREYEWNRNIDWSKPLQIYGATWRALYFQGTTEGGFTTVTLIKTFLQKEYDGDWIDGVSFMYEDQPIGEDWEHISLSGVIYRDK